MARAAPSLIAECASLGQLSRIFEAMRDLLTEARLCFTPTGLHVEEMDPSHTAFVYLDLAAKTFFKKYKCDIPLTLGVSMASLCAVFKHAVCGRTPGTPVCLRTYGADPTVLEVEAGDRGEFRAELHLIKIDSQKMSLPDTATRFSMTMKTVRFRTLLLGNLNNATSVRILASESPTYVQFRADVENFGKCCEMFKDKDDPDLKIGVSDGGVHAVYSWKLLSRLAKGFCVSDSVRIQIDKNKLLTTEHDLEGGLLRFYVSSQVTDEEEASADDDSKSMESQEVWDS